MKTKALLLGARPPFEGPWVPIRDGAVWDLRVATQPADFSLDGKLKLQVQGTAASSIRLPSGELLSGEMVRASVGTVDRLHLVSVYLEESEDES